MLTSLHRYSIDNGLLRYRTDVADTARIFVPHGEDLKYRILFEAHDTALSRHLGREKTYGSVTQHYCPKLYKWVNAYMRNVQAGQTLGTFGCATRQFTCAHGV